MGPHEGRAQLRCIMEGGWYPVLLEGSVAVGGLLLMRDGPQPYEGHRAPH